MKNLQLQIDTLRFKNRWDVSKDNGPRTTAAISQCVANTNSSMGCKNPPLLHFEVSDIIIDELHLMLRVTDVLLRNLIWAMIHNDLKKRDGSSTNLNRLVHEITSCGITFKVNHVHNIINILLHKHIPKHTTKGVESQGREGRT